MIEIECSTDGQFRNAGRMYTCEHIVGKLFHGDWSRKKFIACLERAPRLSKRPRRDAVKIKVPRKFRHEGINVEQPDGTFISNVLTFDADWHVNHHKLDGHSWWVWIELED